MEQLYTFTTPDRDPRMRVIDIAYLTLLQTCPVTSGDDAKMRRGLMYHLRIMSLFLKMQKKCIYKIFSFQEIL